MLAPWEGLGDQSLPVTLGLGGRPGGGPAVLAGAWLALFSGLGPAHLLLRAPSEVNPLLVHPLSLYPLDEAEEILVWHGGATGQNSRWAAALVINPGGLGGHGLLAASSGQDPLGSCSQCWSRRGLWVRLSRKPPGCGWGSGSPVRSGYSFQTQTAVPGTGKRGPRWLSRQAVEQEVHKLVQRPQWAPRVCVQTGGWRALGRDGLGGAVLWEGR